MAYESEYRDWLDSITPEITPPAEPTVFYATTTPRVSDEPIRWGKEGEIEGVRYDAEGLARELRLTATERLAVGLDLPLELIEDQSHIVRGEN
jgi:hypothetical protein